MSVSRPEAQCSYTVGLTGGIGSGKSTVSDQFARLGAQVVDTDLIAHALTRSGGSAMPAIVDSFGAALQQADGALDRVAMRQLVFADPPARLRLEAILHPLIRSEALQQLAQARSGYALLVVPLLVESGIWRAHCQRILVVDCAPEIQVQRIMARSGLSEAEARRIIAAQASREERLAAADDILDNTGEASSLAPAIAALHQRYVLESAKPGSTA